MGAVHTYPPDDIIQHEISGGALCDCICGPDVVYHEGGGVQVIHHSLDGREFHDIKPIENTSPPPKPLTKYEGYALIFIGLAIVAPWVAIVGIVWILSRGL